MGVRKTNCRGRLARSGTVAGSLPQLANTLTIGELQNREQRSRINSSPVKKVTYLFGEALASVHKSLRLCDLCKELGFDCSDAHTVREGWFGKLRPTLVWCSCAR